MIGRAIEPEPPPSSRSIEPASDEDMLRHLIEAKGFKKAQVSRDTAVPKSPVSEILAGKKRFSRQIIRKFAGYFGVDASILAANF
jgi:HTH-type transcriptional regulator/antitoxin HigA